MQSPGTLWLCCSCTTLPLLEVALSRLQPPGTFSLHGSQTLLIQGHALHSCPAGQ